MNVCFFSLCARSSPGSRFVSSSPKTAMQTWLHTHYRYAVHNRFFERVQNFNQLVFRLIEKAVIVQWPAATHVFFGYDDAASRIFQHLDSCLSDFGMKVIAERIGPEDDRSSGLILRSAVAEP